MCRNKQLQYASKNNRNKTNTENDFLPFLPKVTDILTVFKPTKKMKDALKLDTHTRDPLVTSGRGV